jgi:uncharacterized membrane protein
MRTWFANKWEDLRTSLWFLPSLLVALCMMLAMVTLAGDEYLTARDSEALPYLFSGTADAARAMLSTIASSLLTVLSIAYSLTMVALQQASSQFSPRVLRAITSSRVNQAVVGVYAGTFIYALLVLRTIRGEHAAAPFVPALSVTSAVVLALVCIALLVYFIHHVSLSLQVSEVIKDLHDELIAQLERLFPEHVNAPSEAADSSKISTDELAERERVCARVGGFVRRIDPSLSDLRANEATVWLTAKVGEYVPRGGVLAHVARSDAELSEKVRAAYILGSERSYAQDPLFEVRQLVDIALRALSPGINDPTTAEYVLRQLGDALTLLAGRRIPSQRLDAKPGRLRVVTDGPDWQTFIEDSFGQIRRACRTDFHVTRCLLEVLHALAEHTTTEPRASAVRVHVTEVRLGLHESGFSSADCEQLRVACERATEALMPSAVRARGADMEARSPLPAPEGAYSTRVDV